jgi:hypothetical protein
MTANKLAASPAINPAAIETFMHKARVDRAEAMRKALTALPALVRTLTAHAQPARPPLRQAGALAR